jgi:hypothetical protein
MTRLAIMGAIAQLSHAVQKRKLPPRKPVYFVSQFSFDGSGFASCAITS